MNEEHQFKICVKKKSRTSRTGYGSKIWFDSTALDLTWRRHKVGKEMSSLELCIKPS